MITRLKTATSATLLTAALLYAPSAAAHCQVPCGIYDDHTRVHMMREDIKTVAKAVKKINSLTKKRDAKSRNQLVRWVFNKEKHAERIIRTVSDYFLTQKIKAPKGKATNAYLQKLAKHHKVMVAAMKCKQSASDKAVAALTKAVDGIAGYWKKK